MVLKIPFNINNSSSTSIYWRIFVNVLYFLNTRLISNSFFYLTIFFEFLFFFVAFSSFFIRKQIGVTFHWHVFNQRKSLIWFHINILNQNDTCSTPKEIFKLIPCHHWTKMTLALCVLWKCIWILNLYLQNSVMLA